MPVYSWLSYSAAKAQLAANLADPGKVRWVDAELGLYIQESLRVWNCMTATWKGETTFNLAPGTASQWINLYSITGSGRGRTITTNDVLKIMEYHLQEPPTGGTWTGTSQFNISDLANAIQRYRDEILQETNCNMAVITLNAPSTVSRTPLPDNVLEVQRARWIPASSQDGTPITLFRDDSIGEEYYNPNYLQSSPGAPQSYNVGSTPPLQMDVDVPPSVPGSYELVVLQAGNPVFPPTASGMFMWDDFTWIAKWGALSSNLGRESEATDRGRAQFCEQRYQDGIKLMQATPWIMFGVINHVPADTPSMQNMDSYAAEWDSQPGDLQNIVLGGMDLVCVMPVAGGPTGVGITVLQSTPVPVLDGDFVQCSRDVWDAILDYAQFLAVFKLGGYEFTQAAELYKSFAKAAATTNVRLQNLGLFADVFLDQGQEQQKRQERFTGGQ